MLPTFISPKFSNRILRDSSLNQAEPSREHKPRLGISQCLLGEPVRYDGGHKRDPFLTDVLTPFVEWIPVCPEVEAGLGTPREAMRLTGNSDSPRLVTIHTKIDHTRLLYQYSRRRIHELHVHDLDGYIFKKNSPSCGHHRVKVYNEKGQPSQQGTGIFSSVFQQAFPLLPIEEEGHLNNGIIRENFIERIFGYRRWKNLLQHSRLTRSGLVQFHVHHKYLLLTHSRPYYQSLEQLVAQAEHYTPRELFARYGPLFRDALKVKATVNKHVKVLQHLARNLKNHLRQAERAKLQENILNYHRQLIPLAIPLTLITHYVRLLPVSSLIDQVYLNPYPQKLMLRNHV